MKFSSPSSNDRKRCGGFTLLEMMITLAIFALLTAAVFGIVSGVLQGSSSLIENQNRRDEVAALNAYLKKQLGEMSAKTSIVTYQRNEDNGLAQNGIILISPKMAIALDSHLQANGYYTMRLSRCPLAAGAEAAASLQLFMHEITSDDPSIVWIPLIHDIKSTGWKFQILNLSDWADVWNDSTVKPNMVEFSMQLAGDIKPVKMDFWIPHLDPAQFDTEALAAIGNSTSQNPDGSSTESTTGNQNSSTTSSSTDTGVVRTVNTVSGQTILGTSPQ